MNFKSVRYKNGEYLVEKTLEFFEEILPKLGYESREGQLEMASDICEAYRDNNHLLVEAGVGIGKSFAYLVPIMYLYQKTYTPVVVSTSTILLQEQLLQDIEFLSKILKIFPEVVLAKGMAHFKCQCRADTFLEKMKKNQEFIDKNENLVAWLSDVCVGDRSELENQIDDSIWNEINVTKCRHEMCEYARECCYKERRNKMNNCRGIILCNHDLLAADLNKKIKRGYMNTILSSYIHMIIVDEAHNLEEKVRNSLKSTCSYNDLKKCIEKSLDYIRKNYNFFIFDQYNQIFELLKQFFESCSIQVEAQIKNQNITMIDSGRYFIDAIVIKTNIIDILKILEQINEKLQFSSETRSTTRLLWDLIDTLEDIIDFFEELIASNSNRIFWIELSRPKVTSNTIKIFSCPKNINEEVSNLFFKQSNYRTILTSATLSNSTYGTAEENYKYIINTLKFPINSTGELSTPKQSPYNYDENTIIYYSNDLPHPIRKRDEFISESIEEICKLLTITKGKTMVLFTAKSDMLDVYARLLKKGIPWKILKQEDNIPQDKIIKAFREDEHSILLGTGAYWEGVNIKGSSLSSLIIFRLPFPVNDPIIEYKRSVSGGKEKGLMEVNVPEMLIKLKQGVGRLIRSADDKGIIAILDSRIGDNYNLPYKNLVWDSFPTKNKTTDLTEIKEFVCKHNI